ncbi:MAG: aminotransferase [Actinobacteria bacterium 13_1_20CM_2_65_11]|nr:MAG: aminotransferase [Chloroflexi bacterium 13_1_40CM_65_17]OLC66427.1 MAG: aminotransferase [Actinobacteria bacterium 13_1_40CM_4_65_12]OLD25183.1 MAG: aminotransferase [Chloroflexi bacterium 13_1_40CM_3_65_12]OLD49837.1 MAG: aminotransferase [Actinobacteria bacterium 13_1_40CM_2_65_8]OLE80968.1 MAG: aminotransferase [Actinobacteria bacterium 13_1_20CM_2_65_11]
MLGTDRLSLKAQSFTESVIREMTRLNHALNGPERAINFAQGYPDFETDPRIVEAAAVALRDGYNQYATTWGAPQLRQAVAKKQSAAWGRDVDPETEITVSCGATEAMIAAMLTAVDPGDEVVIFEPFYENYGPDCILSGSTPRYVTLRPPDWSFDPDELRAAFNRKTRAVVVNTPHNPTGKVYSGSELELIAQLCVEHNAIAITDEIYEHLVYRGRHISLATLEGMADRTITISGASKTFSVTGWRVGWIVAPPDLTGGIRKVHDFLTVGAAHPLQIAIASALDLPPSFYMELVGDYRERRDAIVTGLRECGFDAAMPDGAYYVMAGIDGFGFDDDMAMARHLIERAAVATVPASSFYHDPQRGRGHLRFSFPKRLETIDRGIAALRTLPLPGH